MSFEAKDIIPVEYQALFNVISPIEKSGILKIIKQDFVEVKNKYDKLFFALKEYLIKYKNEDISQLVFIMFGQVCSDILKDEAVIDMLEYYPDSPELQYFKVQQDTDKGIFDGIDEILKKIRLAPDQRNLIFNRLVAADKLASVIMDIQSFLLENMYLATQQKYDNLDEIYEVAEDVWQRAVRWAEAKEIIFLIELASRLIMQRTQLLMTAQNLEQALKYYEDEYNQDVLSQCQSNIMKANILHLDAMLYYQAGQPKRSVESMEKAMKILKKVNGRNSWKSTFYHNYAYMMNLVDPDQCINIYEQCMELLEKTEDFQSMADTLSNMIGLQTQANKKTEARKYLMKLVDILKMSEELLTPFRAYAVASNAMQLDNYELAEEYLTKLEEKVKEVPTLFNQGILAGAKMVYNTEAVVNSEEAYKWGEDSLYYFNKQQDYLNALGSLFNLLSLDFQFYKITTKESYLAKARKRLNELLTLVGVLDLPQWVASKNTTLAGFELLTKNFDEAKKLVDEIPDTEDPKAIANKKMITQLVELAIKRDELEKEGKEPDEIQLDISSEPIINEIASNKDAHMVFTMHMVEKTLQELVSLPQQVDPVKADIKLILLINTAGLTVYTKILDTQKMNQQLISNFISAIDSFGSQLFGTKEPYFSFKRGNNIILFQNINSDLNLAMIVSQENYDAIMKLNTLGKEIGMYLEDKKIDINKTIEEGTDFYKWLQNEVDQII
ncbi:MAG: hypothetical protein ACTSO7_13575 [Candidatus Heimdallarchaeota archaeon]